MTFLCAWRIKYEDKPHVIDVEAYDVYSAAELFLCVMPPSPYPSTPTLTVSWGAEGGQLSLVIHTHRRRSKLYIKP